MPITLYKFSYASSCCTLSTSMEKLEQNSLNLNTLHKYATDLTKLALEGKLDPVIGRQEETDRCLQILCKRSKNNVCLTGEPGVGKSVIVEALAQRIVTSSKLKSHKIISIEMGRLTAGASPRGNFEERLIQLFDEVKESEGRIILFIDQLHTLLGAGSGDAANILKLALAKEQVKCIGATTVEEYKKYIEKDGALKRRFQAIQVKEPSVEEAIEILKRVSIKYETHHNVKYTEDALIASARLSKQYISDRFLPDKAIDLLDEVGSRIQLFHSQVKSPYRIVTPDEIQEMISIWTGIPVQKVSRQESMKLLNMEDTFNGLIIGQEKAVKAVCRAIRRARVGIRDPNRPIANLLFTGPTGVGKTELAKLLAEEFFGSKEDMVRIDMSEYMEKHNVARLFGSPPGYNGHDEGGQLTEAVLRKPHSLILFDEIEKAHRDVFNALLQLLDDARMTDGKGRSVDFRHTIIILTSNIGGIYLTGEYENVKSKVAKELKNNFKPEFLNRLDEVIVFKSLDQLNLNRILKVMVKEVCERVKKSKNIKVEVMQKFEEKLMEEGCNSSYGARPLKRAITRLLEDYLCEEILKGEIEEGDEITIDVDQNGKIVHRSS